MKVYLSVPMIANRALPRAKLMAKAIVDSGNEVTSAWVLGQIEGTVSNVNVFLRDRIGSEECDVLVADVTEPSIGVGMEIMAAYKAGRKIVLVAKKGNVTSRMLQHMEGKETLEYERDSEVYRGLRQLLERIGVAGHDRTTDLRAAEGTGPTMKAALNSKAAPSPIGPYSQGVDAGAVYCSGQIGLEPSTGNLVEGVTPQTSRALSNLDAVLKAAGMGLGNVVKTTVFMVDLTEFAQMNEEYGKHFTPPFPARSTVQVAALPKGARVEIDAVAVR